MRSFEIANDRLHEGGRPVRYVPTPHMGGTITRHRIVVLHDTAGALTPFSSVNWFKDPKAKASAHVVVERDGTVTQMVPLDRVAWHCGKSNWRDVEQPNRIALGVEIVNPGKLTRRTATTAVSWFGTVYDIAAHGIEEAETEAHGKGLWMPYTAAQIDAVEALVRAFKAAYPSLEEVVGHYDIAPRRKVDPTPLMDADRMVAALGASPVAAPANDDAPVPDHWPDEAPPAPEFLQRVQDLLNRLGYRVGAADGKPGPLTRAALLTFQDVNGLPVTGEADGATLAKLEADDAKPMPVSAGRAELTADDLAKRGSADIAEARAKKRVAGTLGGSAAGLVADSVLDLGAAETALQTVEKAKGVAEKGSGLLAWALTPKGLLVVALGLAALYLFHDGTRQQVRRVLKARLGIDLNR